MDLRVAIDRPSAAASTCFAALPPAVAAALLREGRTLLVLRLQSSPPARRPLYVAWAGAASSDGDALGLHQAFAAALSLRDGARVRAEAVAHDGASAAPGGAVCVAARSEADYAAVAATAEFVEGALLQQIRVVCPGLVFPLRLPGRTVLELEVVRARAGGADVPFVVLHSDVEVTVVAPADATAGGTPGASSGPWKLRALPTPRALLAAHPCHLLVSFGREGEAQAADRAAVSVRRTVAVEAAVGALPATIRSSAAFSVPVAHVFVPPHLWWDLGLSPLVPVTVERLAEGTVLDAPARLRLLPTCPDPCEVPVAAGLGGVPTLVYPGMPLANGDWLLAGGGGADADARLMKVSAARRRAPLTFTERYDAPWREARGDGGKDSIGGEGGAADGTASCPPAWRLCGSEAVAAAAESAPPAATARDGLQFRAMLEHWPLDLDPTAAPQLLDGVRGASARAVLRAVTGHFVGNRAKRKVVLLRGAEGSGKTAIARAVARVLRCTSPRHRTVWVRWRAHEGEPRAASAARVRAAFEAARESQPALVVFDDVDTATAPGGRREDAREDLSAIEAAGGAARAHALAREIVGCIMAVVDADVGVIATCGVSGELDGEFAAPGVVTCAVDIKAPDAADRAVILAALVGKRAARACVEGEDERQDGSRGGALGISTELRRQVCRAAAGCHGFWPRDLQRVVDRAALLSKTAPGGEGRGGDAAILPAALAEAAAAVIPLSRLGVRCDAAEPAGAADSWDDVGGLWHAKSALRETLELPARFPRVFAGAPVRLQTGVLLYGPPGTGKSVLAAVAARACGLRSLAVKGPELLSKYIGESEAEVRRLFQRAATLAPCVVIFDEFDALAPRRGGESTGVADRVVNTLLTSLDGVEGLAKGVFVVATTSHPELIDPAVLRPGRIDRWIAVDFPDDEERREIVQCLWTGMSVGDSASSASGLRQIAEATSGMSGADIRGALADACFAAGAGGCIELGTLLAAVGAARPSVSARERERYRAVMTVFGRRPGSESAAVTSTFEGKHAVRVALQ
jgi:SpoVK/Ycf46/Vps4 family AAA+-type ATPase